MVEVWLLSIALLFSMHQVSVRIGTLRADTLNGTLVSIATTAFIFSTISLFFVLRGLRLNGNFLAVMVLAGLLHFFLARTVFYQCISRLGANVAATLATTRIFFAALLGYVLLGETVSVKLALAGVLVFSGVCVLTFQVVSDLYGIALGLATGFLTAFASVFAKEGMVKFPGIESAAAGTAVGYIASLVAFLIFLNIVRNIRCVVGCVGGTKVKKVERVERKELKKEIRRYCPFFAGGVFVGFGHLLRYVALSYYSVCMVETFVSMYPLFTYLLSGIFVRRAEVFSLRFFASACLILAGAVVLLSPVKL